MKKTLAFILALLLVLPLCACEKETDGDNAVATASNNVYSVATYKELKEAKGFDDGDIIVMSGYYSSNDGGGGRFAYKASGEYTENGGTVITAADGGTFVRLCADNERNILWFGAKPGDSGDDGAAIEAAVNSLPATGGTVVCPGGEYTLFDTLNIGNGDSASTASAINGIKLIGDGGFYGTVFKAAQKFDVLMSVNGSMTDLTVDGIELNCDLKVNTALELNSVRNSSFTNLYLFQYLESGMLLQSGGTKASNISENNSFLNVTVISLANTEGITCIDIGGDYDTGKPVTNCTFTTCRFDTHLAQNAFAAIVSYADGLSFYRCHFCFYDSSSTGLTLDAQNNDGYPKNLAFYDCSVNSTVVREDNKNKIGACTFYGQGTYDNEVVLDHDMISGITDDGSPIGLNITSTGTLPSKKSDFELYSNAEYVPYQLNTGGHTAAVRFNNAGSWTGGILYCPSYDDNTGGFSLAVLKWDTDYSTTLKGEKLWTGSFENFTDNSWLTFEFDEAFSKGEYMLLLYNAHDTGFGVGVWTKGKGAGIETYLSGVKSDGGLVGSFYID